MMEIQKEELVEFQISDDQRKKINSYCTKVEKTTLEEVCPALLRVLLNSEKGALKNQLGNIIFHLQKNERIETVIGLQKLVEAGLKVAPDKMYEILETSDSDAQELAEKIKQTLKG